MPSGQYHSHSCTLVCILALAAMGLGHSSTEGVRIPWPPTEKYFQQAIDHFSFHAANLTYRMRYLYADNWYRPSGPIFFYCGNEGPIDSFWNNSGFIFDVASDMNALVVFAEHRYYGKSLPFPRSFEQPFIQFLSVDQALADYAYLMKELKGQYGLHTPIIGFGGSYGGMLSAYMRVKYPHLVTGSIASSAPVNWVAGVGNIHGFFEAVTNDFKMVKPECSDKIEESYKLIDTTYRADPSTWPTLSTQLRLCEPIKTMKEFDWVLKWTRNAFVMMAMMDYPTNSSFMADLPAYPVNVSCAQALATPGPVARLREAVAVFYNNTAVDCFDYKTQFIECADITGCGADDSSSAWDFQCCTEMNLYDPSGHTPADMFPSLPLSNETLTTYCKSRWGVTPAHEQLATFYGPGVWKFATNIAFTNGDLDPWMNGGILEDQSPTVRTFIIHGGAHHLELRSPDPSTDPPSVRQVRQALVDNILTWIDHEHF